MRLDAGSGLVLAGDMFNICIDLVCFNQRNHAAAKTGPGLAGTNDTRAVIMAPSWLP